ncbi:ROK family protein, partial [Myxococcota bacterium]|nr:ROK family protein [Myxococcota bacterium]
MSDFLGVDIGASTVKLGLIDARGEVVGARLDLPSRANEGPEATLAVITAAVPDLLRALGDTHSTLRGVGVCCPTPISAEGECLHPPNIDASWSGFRVRDALSAALERPVFLLNDGDAAAFREFSVRAARGLASKGMAQFITGTGLGGALILNGAVFSGPIVAGELGHVVTDTSQTADRCGCGALGCAETRASLTGLANLVRLYGRRGPLPEALQGDPKRASYRLRALVQQPKVDPIVQAIWDDYFHHIGLAARSVANIIGCDLIVLSGGAQERESGTDEADWRRYLDRGVGIVRETLCASFPHLHSVRVEWALDALPDSAAYGAA